MNQNGGSRTETLVKLVLIFVVSLLSFSVGTFVGKQFSDSQHKMASLEKEFDVDRNVASENIPVSTNQNKEEALTDEDIASLTQEFIDAEKTDAPGKITSDIEEAKLKELEEQVKARLAAASLAKAAVPKAVANTISQPNSKARTLALPKKSEAISQASKRVAQGLSPTPNPKPTKRRPASLPKMVSSSTIGKYTVQVASYSLETDAKLHAKGLIEKGFSAFYIEAMIKGKKWYRVSVGLFGSRKGAVKYRRSFMKQAKVDAAIVQKIIR